MVTRVQTATDWLLEDNQPSMRYLTLTELLGRRPNDPEVESARKDIAKRGWAAEILSKQKPGGWWVREETVYRPKFLSTNWMLLILSDLGLTREDPRIARACELWMEHFSKKDGGFGTDGSNRSELCIVGNTARALVRFGYEDDPRVKSAFEWLVKNQMSNGGWACFGSTGNIDSWEGMSALAAYPRRRYTKSMKKAVERGAEFYLKRAMDQQGARYEPWYRFHYPVHYFYDLLVGLDFMTTLGYGAEKRLASAIALLKAKKAEGPAGEGVWKLDAVHPDVEGSTAEWYAKHPHQAPTPFGLEKAGQPSKMITFRALRVLKRLGE